jgi:exodeoxyribonuclease X
LLLWLPKDVTDYVGDKNNWICTWRLAKAVYGIDYPSISSFGLNYLRYYFDLPVSDDLIIHRAEADVVLCGELLLHLLSRIVDNKLIDMEKDVKSQLIALCSNPVQVKTFPFGKHKGVALADIPTDYYVWAINNMDAFKEGNARYDMDLAASVAKILEERLQ